MDHFDKFCARICVSFADKKKRRTDKKVKLFGAIAWYRKYADKKYIF
jgi:hypothetical protein